MGVFFFLLRLLALPLRPTAGWKRKVTRVEWNFFSPHSPRDWLLLVLLGFELLKDRLLIIHSTRLSFSIDLQSVFFFCKTLLFTFSPKQFPRITRKFFQDEFCAQLCFFVEWVTAIFAPLRWAGPAVPGPEVALPTESAQSGSRAKQKRKRKRPRHTPSIQSSTK